MSLGQLRPMGIGEILDAAITVYRRNAGTLKADSCKPYVSMARAAFYLVR